MMSDPAGKGEIEDVIASIRRLVRSAPDAHRLVLTEALRVDAPRDGAEDDAGASAAGADGPGETARDGAPGEAPAMHDTALSLEKALAELEAELAVDAAMGSVRAARYDAWEPVDLSDRAAADADGIDLAVAATTIEAEVVMFSRAGANARPAARGDAAADAAEGAGAPVGQGAADAGAAAADSPIGDAVAVEAAADDGTVSGAGGVEAVDAPPAAEAEAAGAADAGMAASPETAAEIAEAEIVETVAEIEILDPEPGPAETEAQAGGASPRYRPVDPDPPAAEPVENVAAPDAESLLDEGELRALVAEVLREELKGPLGERITRNVRKLVRREIAQALSNYDLG